MGKATSVPTITSLTEEFPYPIKNLELLGLVLKKGATVTIEVDQAEESEEVTVGLWFEANDREVRFAFEDVVFLTQIPPMKISTAVMAEAVHDPATGFNMAELAKQVFAAALAETAEVVIELDDNDGERMVEMSVSAGTISVSHVIPFAHVSFALELERAEDDDDKTDADDGVGD